MKKKQVLILGCGDVGCALGNTLTMKGNYDVWGVRRDISKLPANIIPMVLDITQPIPHQRLPNPIDCVVYCAAPNERSVTSYELTYLKGLENCIHALQEDQNPIKRLFLTSSTRVYHQNSGEWVNETSDTHPQDEQGQILLRSEAIASQSNIPSTILRFGGIYGPTKTHLIKHVLRGLGCKKMPPIFSNRIHISDCAGMINFLMETAEEKGEANELYLGVDDCPTPLYEIVEWLAAQFELTLEPSDINLGHSNKRCSSQKISSAGYKFRYPDYKAGYLSILKKNLLYKIT